MVNTGRQSWIGVDGLKDLKRKACDSKLSKDQNLDGLLNTRYLQIQSNCGPSTFYFNRWPCILTQNTDHYWPGPYIQIQKYCPVRPKTVHFWIDRTPWSDSIQSLLMPNPWNSLICSTKTMFWYDNKDVTLCLLHSPYSECLSHLVECEK